MTLFRVLTVRLRVRVTLLFKRSITPESPLSKHFALMLGADLADVIVLVSSIVPLSGGLSD